MTISRFSFLILGSLFALVSCSLPGTQVEIKVDGSSQYVGTGFSISYPTTWNEVKNTDLPHPYRGMIVFARVSPEIKYGFSQNMLVMQDSLDIPVTSLSYSEKNNIQTTKNYLEYTKLQDDVISFNDSDTSRVYIFEARYNTTSQRMKFLQTAKVCGTKVFVLHITLGLDKDPAKYKELFSTFHCGK